MHISLVLQSLHIGGGVERFVSTLSERMITRGHRCDIVLTDKQIIDTRMKLPKDSFIFTQMVDEHTNIREENNKYNLGDLIIRKISKPTNKLFNFMDVLRSFSWSVNGIRCNLNRELLDRSGIISSYLNIENPDVILTNNPKCSVACLFLARHLDKAPPIIPIIHGVMSNFRSAKVKRSLRRQVAGATHFVAVSKSVADDLSMNVGVPRNKITTIYNPAVPRNINSKASEHPGHSWLTDGGPPIILSVGRLGEQKNHSTLIKAFFHLNSQYPCRLIILGEGRDRAKLEGLVQKLNLVDRVSLPGEVENPFAFMSRASLFVLASKREGFGLVLVEAMACGCPVVSTGYLAGPGEILRNGEFGPLVPDDDEVALAGAMRRVLDQPPDRDALRQRAAYFSVDRAVNAYEEMLAYQILN